MTILYLFTSNDYCDTLLNILINKADQRRFGLFQAGTHND